MNRYDFELFADYFQFYLQDDDINLGDLSDAWDDAATQRMLAVAEGVVGVGTARNMDVPVTVEVHVGEPHIPDEAQRVCECSLTIRTGWIVAAGCTDYFPDAARIPVAPGCYRVRVSYFNLDSVVGLDGDDRYLVQLWRASAIPVTVHRP